MSLRDSFVARWPYFAGAAAILVLDQLTKLLAEDKLRGMPDSPLVAVLALARAQRAEGAGDEDARRAALDRAIRHYREAGESELAEQVARRL